MPHVPMCNLSMEERGVSVIVGSVLVISLVFIGIGVYIIEVVPGFERKNEGDHMHEVRGIFLELHGAILNHESTTISLPMAAESAPLFGPPPAPSTLTVTPARAVKRFLPAADAWVDSEFPDTNFGDRENLWVRSYRPVGSPQAYNRRTYLRFDLLSELPGVSPAHVAKAWLVLYCENISKFRGAP